jgi:hypothetical protein
MVRKFNLQLTFQLLTRFNRDFVFTAIRQAIAKSLVAFYQKCTFDVLYIYIVLLSQFNPLFAGFLFYCLCIQSVHIISESRSAMLV